ncbi:protein IQ-DOMAIN 32 isoform X2 [Punica granatum]|uniref:Protein IQ-DOMAIN 32 isoform X2 n=1 Tax=Punica granatum TaxID=22663 RepID=A0A6P8E452_PUNGR|nr:protein IQ-DOMAIN 32 isoform X2 [Punica granatum]
MGRSTASCFKIIACGGDSAADEDDVEAPEIKGDKRGWSFRKRSARHRVLSNTVISETAPPPPPVVKKEAPESAADVNFELPTNIEVPEKVPVPQCVDEKPQLPASVDSKPFDADPVLDTEIESNVDFKMEESTVVLIQSAVRRFLAQKECLRLKNVIKLQAAVRGHLVRKHAVGTLRCVQAIVKMQALVRAHQARALAEGLLADNNVEDGKPNEDVHKSQASDKANVKSKLSVTYVSIEKLLSNRFARQLLESTPREKPINIKCDMSKSNSAWTWLERWMSVYSAEPSPNNDLTPVPSNSENTSSKSESENSLASQAETENPPEVCSEPADSVASKNVAARTLESDDNLITHDEDKIKFEECQSAASVVQEITAPPVVEEITEPEHPQSGEVGAYSEKEIPSTESSGAEKHTPHGKPEMETEQPKRSMKRSATEELETEGKKSVFGSKKATNPAFIAAQSKFEVLTSTAISSGSINMSGESKLETAVLQEDSVTETKEFSLADNSANHQMRTQVGGSECGTELSISSTLDSPDRYDAGTMELENNAKGPEEESCSSTGFKDQKVEAASTSILDSTSDHPEKNNDDVTGETANSIKASEAVQEETITSPDLQREVYNETARQAHNGSPEASPWSHITVPESQGTPASQVSVNTKGSKVEKTGSNSIHKRKSLSKKSPSSPYNDSGASSKNKQSGKDQKSSKRRSSFGSAKAENADQEPRDSSSSNSLPHFMQATESARAKVNANNSPRSSPDVSDREVFVKKRHSLPGSNGRQGSPRIQRSTSQAQQGGQVNGGPAQGIPEALAFPILHSELPLSLERKWLR